MVSPIVGIDLGTTLSAVGHYDRGRVHLFANELGDVLTPSAVAVDPRSSTAVVGRVAKDLAASHPERGALAFKRDMGTNRVLTLGERQFTPVELSAYVLDALRADAERALGGAVNRCVVSVPAYFSDAQRIATRQAAEMAGFSVERMINEPTAAAIAFGLHEGDEDSTFLVFDLGGGTFDVCVMERFEGVLQVKGVAGESRLGGEDFTQALLELVLARADVDPARARETDPAAYAIAFKRAELLKRKLSRWPNAIMNVPKFEGSSRSERTIEVASEEADVAYRPLLERLRAPCRAALRGADVEIDELDAVVLVGGATRLPCVERFARDLFGREPRIDPEPDRLVARGAAIQAALCDDSSAVGDVVVTDVLSHSLGTDTSRVVGERRVGDLFSPIIHRNTVIPTSRTVVYAPVDEQQQKLSFSILEGESRKASDNTLLGEVVVPLPKSGDRGVAMTFTFDVNGILEAEAVVRQTGEVFSKVFSRTRGELSDEERTAAMARIQQLKAKTAVRPRHLELRARAELLWKELGPNEREQLGRAIDVFLAALEARIPEDMEAAADNLRRLCDAFDDEERW